jgi:hypothetical protein
MGYTIFTCKQVTPKYKNVAGPMNTSTAILNPGYPPVYPKGASVLYRPPTFDVYSENTLDRQILLNDPSGIATWDIVVKTFPLYIEEIKNKIRVETQKKILDSYPVWYQINAALGLYDLKKVEVMKADIVSAITESNRCEQLVSDGSTYVLNLPTMQKASLGA